MKDLEKKIRELTRIVKALVTLSLEIGTLIAVIKLILESLFK